jgi:hypothetical protein
MGGLRSRRLGCCRIPVLLHVQLWCYVGPSTMGYAFRNLPIFLESKGCRTINVLQLVQQLHHCKLSPHL